MYKLKTPWISQSFQWLWLSNWRNPFIQSVCHSCHRASWRSNATTCCINITESHSSWWFQPPLFRKKMLNCLGSSFFKFQEDGNISWVINFQYAKAVSWSTRSKPAKDSRPKDANNSRSIPFSEVLVVVEPTQSKNMRKSKWVHLHQNTGEHKKYLSCHLEFLGYPHVLDLSQAINRNCRGFTASEGHAGPRLETEIIHGLIQQKISLLHHPIILCWRFTSDAHLCLYISICMNYEILPTRFPWKKRRIPDVTNDLLWKKFLILSVTKWRMIPNLSQERSNHDPHFSTFKHFHCCLIVDSTVTALYHWH